MNYKLFLTYLLIMALVTYLIRALPLILIKKPIKNKFLLSFLQYIPYAVLTAMTIPAIFHSTSSIYSAIIGFVVAFVLAFMEKSLVLVAGASCAAVLISELAVKLILH